MASYDLSYVRNLTPQIYRFKLNGTNFIPLLVFNINEELTLSDSWTFPSFSTAEAYNFLGDENVTGVSGIDITTSPYSVGYYTYLLSDKIHIQYDSSLDYIKCYVSPDFTNVIVQSAVIRSARYCTLNGFAFAIMVTPGGVPFLAQNFLITYRSSTGISIPADDNKGYILQDSSVNVTGNASTYGLNTSTQQNQAATLFNGAKLYDPDDPFNGADDSSPNGGGGNMDYDSDDDDFPALPTNTVSDSGFVTLYAPTAAQLKSLADYLWSDTFSLDSFKKLFNNPMDCILGLSLVPVNLPHGTAKEITVGNLVSTVSCDTCTTQYVYVDCGSIEVSPESFTNSYLDFSPYTQIMLYLPYIGTQPLDTDEVMGSTIHVRYHIDVLTGAMCCFVKITNKNPISGSSATHVLYTYMGQCCESVPLSSDQWGNTIGAIMQAAAAIGGVVATAASGGAAAPAAAATLTTATTATVNAATSMKPTVNHSGSLGGGGGMMAQRTPKLIMKAPYISKPSKQQNYTGYPVNQTKKLSACSEFTQVQNINLVISAEGVGATQAELTEIENLLISGVYI